MHSVFADVVWRGLEEDEMVGFGLAARCVVIGQPHEIVGVDLALLWFIEMIRNVTKQTDVDFDLVQC